MINIAAARGYRGRERDIHNKYIIKKKRTAGPPHNATNKYMYDYIHKNFSFCEFCFNQFPQSLF